MGQIKVTTCDIEGLKVIEPKVFGDARGYFSSHIIIMIMRQLELHRNLYRITSPHLRKAS